MSHQLNEFKPLDKETQTELLDKATASLEKVGERPLKYMLAYLTAQRVHQIERAVKDSYSPPANDAEAGYNSGKLAGQISILDILIAGVNGELDEKDTAGKEEETGPAESDRFNETTTGGTTTGDGI